MQSESVIKQIMFQEYYIIPSGETELKKGANDLRGCEAHNGS